jgi:hypothetical protein
MFNNRGSSYMTQFARASQIRNVLLCTLATMTLAACGGESSDAGSTAAVSSADTASLVAPNVGMIDRSQDAGGGSASVATAATTPASGTGSSSTASTGSTASSGTGTKVTTPVQVATTNGVATLDWLPPTENTDGSALTNLAGYTVYYGTSPGDLSKSVKVSNPGLASYTVTGLTSGKWYFAVTSVSADGTESTRTTAVSTMI